MTKFTAIRGLPEKIISDKGWNSWPPQTTSWKFKSQEMQWMIHRPVYCWTGRGLGRHPKRHILKTSEKLLWKVRSSIYDELLARNYCHTKNTVLIQIESMLTSKPLAALSIGPTDLQPETAAHFLNGGASKDYHSTTDVSFPDISLSRRFETLEGIQRSFLRTGQILSDYFTGAKKMARFLSYLQWKWPRSDCGRLPSANRIAGIEKLYWQGISWVAKLKTPFGILNRTLMKPRKLPFDILDSHSIHQIWIGAVPYFVISISRIFPPSLPIAGKKFVLRTSETWYVSTYPSTHWLEWFHPVIIFFVHFRCRWLLVKVQIWH